MPPVVAAGGSNTRNRGLLDMELEILTPEKKVFGGKVYGVYLPGTEGAFEVLDRHAALVAALGKGKMKVLTDKNTSQTFEIASGFFEMIHNKATVLVEDVKQLTK
jgi:F-type H+-transporting ATPase subunit epsilon